MWRTSLLIASCASDGGDSGGATAVPPTDLVLEDHHNYQFTGTLEVPETLTTALVDFAVDWSALSLDMQCHPTDPVADIDNLALLVFPYLTTTEVEAGLSGSNLLQADLGGYTSHLPADATDARLTDFTFFGTDVDIETLYAEGSGTWLLLLATGTRIGLGTRMLSFVTPVAAETNTQVDVTDGCAVLNFDADLQSLVPVPVRAGGPWNLDWSGLTVDGQGNPMALGNIDGLMLGHYPDHTAAELEADFVDIELLADAVWELPLASGSTADLSLATADGVPFSGFTSGGTWVLGLRCSTCSNPAPLFLTVLDPR